MSGTEKSSEPGVMDAARSAFANKLRNAVAETVGSETAGAADGPDSDIAGAGRRAVARIRHRETIRQANIEGIIRMAAVGECVSDTKAPVDKAWLVRFFECAQDAGSELERLIWARILAREIDVPGSTGKRALEFLSAMDSWELEGWVEYCAFAFSFESGWRFMFDDETARREMWVYGREIDFTQHWITIGLLSAETGIIKPASAQGLRIRYRDRVYELRGFGVPNEDPNRVESGVVYRRFTVTGQQLAEVIRTKAFFAFARNLIRSINSTHYAGFEQIEPLPGD